MEYIVKKGKGGGDMLLSFLLLLFSLISVLNYYSLTHRH